MYFSVILGLCELLLPVSNLPDPPSCFAEILNCMCEMHLFCSPLPDPPEYANTDPVQFTLLMVGAPFTLNCTPSAANPPVDTVSIEVDRSPVTSSETVTVTDNILTIPSVQRSHSGNYSCTATNTRGSAVIYRNLLVVGACVCLCVCVLLVYI